LDLAKALAAPQLQHLKTTLHTSYLLLQLLTLRETHKLMGSAAVQLESTINHLGKEWKIDVQRWSQNKNIIPEDPKTGKLICGFNLIRFLDLILQPLQNALIFFDQRGDISGDTNEFGTHHRCHFESYKLDPSTRTLELQFRENHQMKGRNQTKGLILKIDQIRTFELLGILFEHPTDNGYYIRNPFRCDEISRPRLHFR
jgi:hypothetical protein